MSAGVLITSNTLHFGGAERQRVQLANGLAARGHPVTLVLLQEAGPLLAEVSGAVGVEHRPWHRPPAPLRRPTVLVTGTTNTEAGFGLLWRTRGRARAADRAHRWVVASHTPPEPDAATYPPLLAAMIRRSDAVVALSPSHWRQLTAHQRLHARPPHVVPNAAPPPRDRAAAPDPGDAVRIVFVGRLVEHKGLGLVLTALGSLGGLGWRLDVYGDGPHRPALERAVPVPVADRVRFRGWVADPASALAGADLLVLPSRREAFPMVLLEAMSAGVATMAGPAGAVPELLAGGAGVLVAAHTAQAWQDALAGVLSAPAALAGIAGRGRDRAGLYTLDRMLDGYEQLIDEVLPG